MDIIGDFAYLDRNRVESFLAAYENGLVVSRAHSKNRSRGGSFGLSGIANIGVKASDSIEEQVSTKTTPVSQFYKLYRELNQTNLIQPLPAFDAEIWTQLAEGEFIEVYARLEISPLENFFSQAQSIWELGVKIGAIDPKDKKNQQTAQAISLFSQSDATTHTFFINPLGAPGTKYRFLAVLDKRSLIVPSDDLAGKFYVFGRIVKVLARNEKIDLLKLPGGVTLPRAQIRRLAQSFRNVPIGGPIKPSDIRVGYPMIQIVPIAIYR